MKRFRNAITVGNIVLAAAFIASAVPAGADETYPFRVAFEEVPGVEYLVAGNPAAGIRVLKEELVSGPASRGHVLATLCGAYILNRQLALAERACADAMARLPGETAYNNRGVLRAFRGDLDGAREDFVRASPHDMDQYMEILRTRDVGLVAVANQELLRKLSAGPASERFGTSHVSIRGAEIEIIDD